jgi:type I restriction enzyme S subunit
LAEQRCIVEAIESYLTRLDNAVALLERVEQNLKRYRASVLKAAVEGRLVPTEAELARREGRDYEPASELLKRILAERKTRWIEDAAEKARAKAEEKARAAGRAWTAADDAAALDRERAKAAKQYKEPAAPDTTELPALPEGWCWVTTEQVGQPGEQSVLTGPFGTTLKSSEFVAVGTPVVTIGCLTEQGINLAKADFITSEKADELARYGLQCGDMLFSRMATVGRAGFVDVSVAAQCPIFNYHIMRLRLHAETIGPRFFLAYVRGSVTVTDYIREINHGMTRDGINTTQLLNMPVVLPPRAEQERIVSEAEHVLSLAQQTSIAAERQRARCARLRQSILKWAFEGKLVEQDPNDEPATVLLERIRTMRSTPCPRRHAS